MTKRILSMLMCLAMIFSMVSGAYASDFESLPAEITEQTESSEPSQDIEILPEWGNEGAPAEAPVQENLSEEPVNNGPWLPLEEANIPEAEEQVIPEELPAPEQQEELIVQNLSLKVPEQQKSLFVIEEEPILPFESFDFHTNTLNDFVITDGAEIFFTKTRMVEGEEGLEEEEYEISLKELQEEAGFVFSTEFAEAGSYYFVLKPAGEHYFADGEAFETAHNETKDAEINYVLYECSVIKAKPKMLSKGAPLMAPKSGIVGVPTQNYTAIKKTGADIDLTTLLQFPADKSSYEFSSGSEIPVKESTVAAEAAAAGYTDCSISKGVVKEKGKYYFVLKPAEGMTFEREQQYEVFKFEVLPKYDITEGNGQVWSLRKSKEGIIFKTNARVADFGSTWVDGVELSEEIGQTCQWDNNDSCDVILYKSFLEMLAPGKHEIVIAFAGGDAVGYFTVIDEDKLPEIDSDFSCIQTGSKMVPTIAKAELKDLITYRNLEPGKEYVLEGVLFYEDGSEILDSNDKQVIATSKFKAGEATALGIKTVEIRFTLDTSDFAGKKIIVAETLKDGENVVVSHKDLMNARQTVAIPSIDVESTVIGLHFANPATDSEIRNEIHYSGLEKGKTYTAHSVLVDAETGLPIEDKEHKQIEGFSDFQAGNSEVVSTMLLFDASELSGKTVAVSEEIYLSETRITGTGAVYGESQKIHYTDISTEATINGAHEAPAASEIKLIDKVSYKNFVADSDFYVRGSLVIVNEDGSTEPVMNGEKQVTSITSVSSDKTEDTLSIEFNFDASGLEGKKIAVLEEIVSDYVTVAEHKDITDPMQIVSFPKIEGSLKDTSGNKSLAANGGASLVETVTLEGLVPNNVYNITATLYSKANEMMIVNGSGKPFAATATVMPETTKTTASLVFDVLDAAAYSGDILVGTLKVFNADNVLVAEKKDLNSDKLSVYFPAFHTFADDGNGSKILSPSENASIVDTIQFSAMRPNEEYTFKGCLVEKSSQAPILAKSGEVYYETIKFRPEQSDGYLEIAYSLNASNLFNKSIVVFEELHNANAMIVCHADIEDENQTVSVQSSPAIYVVNATTGYPVSGALIHIWDLTNGTESDITSDAEGIAYYPLINGHQYKYTEIDPPQGFKLDKNTYYFSVDNAGYSNRSNRTLKNQKIGTVVLSVIDFKTGEPVTGAQISVYDNNGTTLMTQETDGFGQIYFDAFSYADARTGEFKETYKFKEISAPSGYYVDDAVYRFTIDQNEQISGTTTIVNCPTGIVTITKTDTSGNPLAGARISIYSSEGKMLGQATTNSSGHIYFEAQGAGSFYFIEDQAPSGYVRVDQKFAFALDKYGRITGTTTFTNSKTGEAGQNGEGNGSGVSGGVATGDSNMLVYYVIIGVICIAAIGYIVFLRTRNSRKKE